METNLPQCWQTVKDCLENGIDRLILFGPPGTGKTFAGLHYGNVSAGAHRLVCTDDMTNADVTGTYIPSAGDWNWQYGKAIKAWEGDGVVGGRLVVDEIDKAGGDVFATLLSMLDSPESASWENPETGRVHRPRQGFSAVMTTNIEDMRELPDALIDRFPVRVRIDQPHPDALQRLSPDLRNVASRMCDAGDRRISLRAWITFDDLRASVGKERAAEILFGDRAESLIDAMKIDAI